MYHELNDEQLEMVAGGFSFTDQTNYSAIGQEAVANQYAIAYSEGDQYVSKSKYVSGSWDATNINSATNSAYVKQSNKN